MATGAAGTTGDIDTIESALETLQHKLFIRVWKRRLTKSFLSWMAHRYGDSFQALDQHLPPLDHFVSTTQGLSDLDGSAGRGPWPQWMWASHGKKHYHEWCQARCTIGGTDCEVGVDALRRACGTSWWEWELGSTPFHWRWPHFHQLTIRDGLEVYAENKIPVYRIPQRDTKDASQKQAMVRKLHKIRNRGHIAPDDIVSLTTYFSVSKGEDDIRMVFNGTESGLNASTWVPSFWLPTM
jgi:hypothetical protein